MAWDVLRARESAVDIGVCVSRGLQTGGPLVAAPAAAFPVTVRSQVDGQPNIHCSALEHLSVNPVRNERLSPHGMCRVKIFVNFLASEQGSR